jgi:hydrogenase maturation protein HypF
MKASRRVRVEGIVQGVGFRPFVYALAERYALAGQICNDAAGVSIDIEGDEPALDAFLRSLRGDAPALAVIDEVRWQPQPLGGFHEFKIAASRSAPTRRALVSPDTSTCADCLRELFDPSDRRYRYPFINCTNCGPRFTIIEGVPYDRERTTMSTFTMCDACATEYDNPRDRRFHAQPNACADCGPRVRLLDAHGHEDATEDPIARTAELISEGAIVAVKGLGGYHLACDASNQDAVHRLRRRKHREDKPFALMTASLDDARRLCIIDAAEEALLTSKRRPIVLLRRRDPSPVAADVAPGQPTLGIMLPYTPLHHLLLAAAGRPLVMTSGNVSDEPIAYRDADASARLRSIATHFLVHDREIRMRCDDSVTRVVAGRCVMLRRSRGYAPAPIAVPAPFAVPVLACGADLKNTFCLGKGKHAFVSHHIGDLHEHEARVSFEQGIAHFQHLFDIAPAVIAHDLHPDYASTTYAQAIALPHIAVQHHHAHIASCMAEHGLKGPVIGVAFDGTGYGGDGTLWGGEFLIAGYESFERVAHLEYAPLPGGEAAIRGPWRMAASWLRQTYGDGFESLDIDFSRRLRVRPWPLLKQAIDHDVNCPKTSSIGRLFDAVASLAGVRDTINYEGQAAIELEMSADEACTDTYPVEWDEGTPIVLRGQPIIRAVVDDLLARVPVGIIAAKFHNTIAAAITALCVRIATERAITDVALGGGVFQNQRLLVAATASLTNAGLNVFVPEQLPANDGGIALGQAVVANARIIAGSAATPVSAGRG